MLEIIQLSFEVIRKKLPHFSWVRSIRYSFYQRKLEIISHELGRPHLWSFFNPIDKIFPILFLPFGVSN
jgi:hypothetical protein